MFQSTVSIPHPPTSTTSSIYTVLRYCIRPEPAHGCDTRPPLLLASQPRVPVLVPVLLLPTNMPCTWVCCTKPHANSNTKPHANTKPHGLLIHSDGQHKVNQWHPGEAVRASNGTANLADNLVTFTPQSIIDTFSSALTHNFDVGNPAQFCRLSKNMHRIEWFDMGCPESLREVLSRGVLGRTGD